MTPNKTSTNTLQKSKAKRQPKKKNPKMVRPRSAPLTRSAVVRQTVPRTVRDSGHSRDVIGTQLLGTLVAPSTNAFQVPHRFRINPGSYLTFPWTTPQALCYEAYRYKKLVFHYVPFIGKTSSGTVFSTWDYDAADTLPFGVTEQNLFSNERSKESAQYDAHTNPASPAMLNRLYKSHVVMSDLRFDNTSQDEKTIDCAQLYVAVETNSTPGEKLGKMFIEYVVELISPQMQTEQPNQGGFSLNKSSGNQTGTAFAFSTPPTIGMLTQEAQPLLQMCNQIAGFATPTATVGQFTRDFKGLLSVQKRGQAGDTFSASPSLYVGPLANLNAAAGSPGDVLQPQAPNSANVIEDRIVAKTFLVSALAGQLLRLSVLDPTPPIGTTPISICGGGADI